MRILEHFPKINVEEYKALIDILHEKGIVLKQDILTKIELNRDKIIHN